MKKEKRRKKGKWVHPKKSLKGEEGTECVFRVSRDSGKVVCILPEFPADETGEWAPHVLRDGRWGMVKYTTFLKKSKPASPRQYASFRKQLKKEGYDLKVLKRARPGARERRRKEAKQLAIDSVEYLLEC